MESQVKKCQKCEKTSGFFMTINGCCKCSDCMRHELKEEGYTASNVSKKFYESSKKLTKLNKKNG